MFTRFRSLAVVLSVFAFINAEAQITCDFTLNDTVGCSPFILLGTPHETSPFQIMARHWTVTGPGPVNCNYHVNPAPVSTLSFAATCPGTYCVTLWSKNSNNDTTFKTKCNVSVEGAFFHLQPDSNNVGVYYGFNQSYGNNITSYLWEFGDGDTSTLQYPSHTYAQPGQYYVCLTISSANCSNTYCDSSFLVFKTEGGLMSQLNILNSATAVTSLSTPNSTFSIHPNPASTTFTISIPENLIGETVMVMDVTGKQMAAVQLSTLNSAFSIENFSSGVYFVRVGNAVRKLVVQR